MASNQLGKRCVCSGYAANSENGAARVLIDLTIKDRNFNCFYHFKIVNKHAKHPFIKSLIQLFAILSAIPRFLDRRIRFSLQNEFTEPNKLWYCSNLTKIPLKEAFLKYKIF
jgi:hypothetical protein